MLTPKRGDENFEALRKDKTKISLPTEREQQINKFNTAINMMKDFRYQPWMTNSDVISEKGERINSNGKIYIPKFKRKM